MHKLLLLLLLFSLHGFSQFRIMDSQLEEKSFRMLHRPLTENKLSKYLKMHLSDDEIRNLSYKTPPNSHQSIRAQFQVSANGRPWNFRIYTGNRDLNKKLEKLLREFLQNEVSNLSELHESINKIQLFSKEGNKNIINASSIIVSTFPPVFSYVDNLSQSNSENVFYADGNISKEAKTSLKKKVSTTTFDTPPLYTSDVFKRFPISGKCQNISFDDAYGCFKKNLENFIIKNLNQELIKKEKVTGELKTNISFKINKKGLITDVNCYSISSTFDAEINRIVQLFGTTVVQPANRNGVPLETSVNMSLPLFISESFTNEEFLSLKNNSFTSFFKENLKAKDIESAIIGPSKPAVKVFFSFNKKGDLYSVWTNTTNEKLKKTLIKAFKKYPINALNLNKSINRIYALGIIRKFKGKKQVLCDKELEWLSVGSYQKCTSCNNSKSIDEFNIRQIQNYIIAKFNSKNNKHKLTKGYMPVKGPHLKVWAYVTSGGSIQINKIAKIDKISSTNPENPIIKQVNAIVSLMPEYFIKPLKNGKPHRANLGLMTFQIK